MDDTLRAAVLAGVLTEDQAREKQKLLEEGGNFIQPEDHHDFVYGENEEQEKYEAKEDYDKVVQVAADNVGKVVEAIAQKFGWKPADVLYVANDQLTTYYENRADPVGERKEEPKLAVDPNEPTNDSYTRTDEPGPA